MEILLWCVVIREADKHRLHTFNWENEVVRSTVIRLMKYETNSGKGHADWLFTIQLTTPTFMLIDVVLNIYNRCHTLLILKLHKENDNDFCLWIKSVSISKNLYCLQPFFSLASPRGPANIYLCRGIISCMRQ